MASPVDAIVLQGSARKCTSTCGDLFFPMRNTEFGDKDFVLCAETYRVSRKSAAERRVTVDSGIAEFDSLMAT